MLNLTRRSEPGSDTIEVFDARTSELIFRVLVREGRHGKINVTFDAPPWMCPVRSELPQDFKNDLVLRAQQRLREASQDATPEPSP